jgi:hypothetical protein
MSSAVRSPALRQEGLVRFVKVESPSYNNGYNTVLFPFTYSNQVLDITYAGNNFKSVMVDEINESPSGEASLSISMLGGLNLATSLGPNFKAYIRSWRSGTIDAGSPIEVVVAPQMIRAQEASFGNISSSSGNSWKITISQPTGDNYITGDSNNKYRTTYIFKTPLTFSIVESGEKKYITFKTVFDHED